MGLKAKKYNDWQLLDKLPDNWKIDKTCGSPLYGYEFCTDGKSILNGGKRALVRIKKKYCNSTKAILN